MSEQRNEQDADAPLFGRARNPDADTTQVAFQCPKNILVWLDAVSMARGGDRGPLIVEILGKWAEVEEHRHMVVGRVLAGNRTGSDSPNTMALPVRDMSGARA